MAIQTVRFGYDEPTHKRSSLRTLVLATVAVWGTIAVSLVELVPVTPSFSLPALVDRVEYDARRNTVLTTLGDYMNENLGFCGDDILNYVKDSLYVE